MSNFLGAVIMAEELKDSVEKKPKKPIFIILFIFLVLFFLYYKEFAKEHARLVEEHRIAAMKFDEKAKECLAEKVIRDAEEARQKRLAAEAAEIERLRALQVKIVKDFYQAVNKHDCITATQLRANYSQAECLKIRSIRLNAVKIVKNTPTISVAKIKVAYRQKGKREQYHFAGYFQLGKQDDQWVIIGNFSSKLSLEEYLKKYQIAGAR